MPPKREAALLLAEAEVVRAAAVVEGAASDAALVVDSAVWAQPQLDATA